MKLNKKESARFRKREVATRSKAAPLKEVKAAVEVFCKICNNTRSCKSKVD